MALFDGTDPSTMVGTPPPTARRRIHRVTKMTKQSGAISNAPVSETDPHSTLGETSTSAAFDFELPTDRAGTDSLKWDGPANELPMWVADMDFPTAPVVAEAVQRVAATGLYGYTHVPDRFREAVSHWWGERHGYTFAPDEVLFATGVMPAISSTIRKLTTPAENVLIQPPVYGIFYPAIRDNGRTVLENELVYENGLYRIDFDDLERKLADPQTTLMLLCNPHNPIGYLWDRETLARIGDLCAKHHVLVLSDEIHCDITRPGLDYTPFAAVSETTRANAITFVSPTKTFNIAGVQSSAVIVSDPVLRHKIHRALEADGVAEPNAFAMPATIAAFTEGAPWLDALRSTIAENADTAVDFIRREIPQITTKVPQATYLLWLDCSAITDDSTELAARLRSETGLRLSEGAGFGGNGDRFLRMNLATQRSRLLDGLERLKAGLRAQ
ncbi:MAG: pyridoxal phosphate-dependent aminotransferase [Propionibacteriaceae bacterium]|jgi:cystathionine beta-lyase|nr:pyridoxal phosphate-dependent aminotransferase [Propionibacteriaceae bacterium]